MFVIVKPNVRSPVLIMLHVVIKLLLKFLQSVGCKDQLLQLLCDYVKNLEKRVFPYAVEIKVNFTLHLCHGYPRLGSKCCHRCYRLIDNLVRFRNVGIL